MNTTTQATEAVIDRAAFGSNIRHLMSVVAPAELMVVLKANAYGHGLVEMAHAAVDAGARRLGVLEAESGVRLRDSGVTDDVIVMAWQYPATQDFGPAVAAHVDLGVSQRSELRAIVSAEAGTPASIHLKIDTGLNRNGATAEEWPRLVAAAKAEQDIGRVRIAGIWSHIAEASEEEDTLARSRFEQAIIVARGLGVEFPIRHLAASSAGLRRDDVRFDMVRMGGHCWGIPSFDGVTPADIGIIPVMTLRSEVTGLRVDGDAMRAIIPLGFADGIPLRAAGRVDVTIAGARARVLRVHVDSMEVEAVPSAHPGASAVLFGTGSEGEQTVREWGDLTGTLGDEITTRISSAIPRRYIGSAAP
jgi:alanine racemase